MPLFFLWLLWLLQKLYYKTQSNTDRDQRLRGSQVFRFSLFCINKSNDSKNADLTTIGKLCCRTATALTWVQIWSSVYSIAEGKKIEKALSCSETRCDRFASNDLHYSRAVHYFSIILIDIYRFLHKLYDKLSIFNTSLTGNGWALQNSLTN